MAEPKWSRKHARKVVAMLEAGRDSYTGQTSLFDQFHLAMKKARCEYEVPVLRDAWIILGNAWVTRVRIHRGVFASVFDVYDDALAVARLEAEL